MTPIGGFSEEYLKELHRTTLRNRDALLASTKCGCFFCLRRFMAKDIEEWTDGGQTALCPNCGIDSILPGKSCPNLSDDLLIAMNERWFTGRQRKIQEG